MENLRIQDHASFVKANPWPEGKFIMDYIKNLLKIKPWPHAWFYELIRNDGAKFYCHDLAKALWHVGSLSNNVDEKMSAYRNVGWKIKAFCEEIAGKSEVLKCMQFYFYLQKDALLGNVLIPRSNRISGFLGLGDGLRYAHTHIELAWDNIGPWRS